MSSTSITLHVPQQPRDEWAALDDPGLSSRQRAASASTVLASTPPVALAKRARHRKPNRRRHVITKVLGYSLVIVAAVFALTGTARTVHQAPAFYGLTPQQFSQVATTLEAPGYQLMSDVTPAPSSEAHACHEAVMFSRGKASRTAVLEAASHADNGLYRAITHYVLDPSEASFWAFMGDCGYGL